MDIDLKRQLVHSIFRFKKAGMRLPQSLNVEMKHFNVNMAELVLMKKILDASGDENACLADLQRFLSITKAAVSQMLGALEKKGYLNREINKNNRRKIVITLTESGLAIIKNAESGFEVMITEIISRFGEEDTKQLILLFKRFSDIADNVKNEYSEKKSERNS
ncbi:MAG: MarR family transcriptional regulator [Clostridiales Family XIII bacterium]|jgi:DNA-binding MarR family transcriptional regulator|nr:MarR family transcriptional regulator [Clostridiales Family XIII bacterium]